ncbi:MAG: MotE family protein [Solibacillus sp.]|jgi:flagellar protein FlbB|uniref:MotE family protein n=2 Tax=unclassified Solibacillus TaxID=2637870 RepID=UPI0030F76198
MSFQLLRITRRKSGDFMAKKNITKLDVQVDEMEVENKPAGFFKKIFYLFLIPLMFVIAIALVIATVTEVNVFKMANNVTEKIPFLNADEQEVVENSTLNGEKVVELQAEIQQKEAQITQLQTQMDAATSEKDELLAEQERLMFEIEKLKRNQEESQKDFTEILSTFEKMSAKTAAPILVQMSDTESLRIMSSMKPDTLSAIFSKMSPEDAARYTELLSQQ